MSKLTNLERYLKSGATATPKQIKKMFGLKNASAAIHELRNRGLCVYANPTTLSNGSKTIRYRIGAPTREMVQTLHAFGFFS